MQVCSLAGGLLNVLRLPERWLQPTDPAKPAPLDYALNSHQVGTPVMAGFMQPLQGGISCCRHQGWQPPRQPASLPANGASLCPTACPCLQLMHLLVAAAMWQLHLGSAADYRSVSALLDGTAQCPV